MFIGQGRGNAGALDAIDEAQFDGRGGDASAGISRGDKGIGLASFDEIHGDIDRRLLFTAHGFCSGLRHADDFRGMNDADFFAG